MTAAFEAVNRKPRLINIRNVRYPSQLFNQTLLSITVILTIRHQV